MSVELLVDRSDYEENQGVEGLTTEEQETFNGLVDRLAMTPEVEDWMADTMPVKRGSPDGTFIPGTM